MPFLRVIRDKRGYETTYLMHIYRDGARQRSKILYVFRTPGGVRVGRDPLEPEVQRQIEALYPDITFNWSAVRDSQQVIETVVEPRRRRPKREDEAPGDAATAPPAVSQPTAPREAPAPHVVIPSAIEGATPDEQIAFLGQWHPIIRERIAKRTSDPMRLEALTALVDRLNPSAWTDADQITTGLEAAAEALERLSHVLSKRRRRRRRSGEARPAESGSGSG
ncbi:MAG TPA: hypothetical protein VKB50_22845 [Vicinamibacterales bacterium]|nr:hypothetical protein [Vicinamibacterales bacterium]